MTKILKLSSFYRVKYFDTKVTDFKTPLKNHQHFLEENWKPIRTFFN